MSETASHATTADHDPNSPAALTLGTRDGRRYVRRFEVREQIRQVLGADPPAWDVPDFRSETIVHLLRKYRDDSLTMPEFKTLLRELGRRIARIVGDNSHGVERQARDDLIDSIQDRIVNLLFEAAPTRKGEFLEVSFRKVVRGLALNAVEAHFTRRNEYSEFRIADGTPEEDAGIVVADGALPPDEVMILFEGLDAIADPRHREAFVLRYGYRWPIRSHDPNTPTLCRRFKIKERQINTWLRASMSQVRERLGEQL